MDSLEFNRRFRKLQEQYLADTREQITHWATLLGAGRELSKAEYAELHRLVHSVKGSGGTHRFAALTENAAKIDDAMEAGIELAPLGKMIGELLGLHRRLCDDLENQ